ncbi:MAG TPA: hypothetical protein VFM38_13425 [Candidatus Limnocylindrales bacterium]|nr:hypothetical protein [Candidatus Limnocylindrales bacterium]
MAEPVTPASIVFDLTTARVSILSARGASRRSKRSPQETLYKEADVVLLWILVALLLLFAIVGGVAISKFLFFVLIVAGILALIGLFTRTA